MPGTALSATIDIVRLKVGDTDMADPLLTDDELATCVVAWPDNPDLAAANAAEAIAAQFGREFNFQTDQQFFNRSERVNHYLTLANQLRARGGMYAIPSGTAGTVPTWTAQAGTIT